MHKLTPGDPAGSTPILAADYYLTNFQQLVNWVQQHYDDLLNHEEQQFLARFQQLKRNSQCLFVRLSSRKGPLFRHDKLQYAEIDSIEDAANELIQTGMLDDRSLLSIQEVSSLLTKVELNNLFNAHVRGIKQLRKEELIIQLINSFPEPKQWQEWTRDQFGPVYRLNTQSMINNLLLIFFGNTYQDLTEFVLQDLGLFRYENYAIDHQHRIFKSRDELEQYLQLIELRDQLEQADTAEQLLHIANNLPAVSTNNNLERRRAKLCNQLAYELERIQEHQLAASIYSQSHLPPARERRIRLLEKQGNLSAAWALLNELLQTPSNEQELQVAQRMAPRLAKKLGEQITAKKISTPVEKHLKLARLVDENNDFLRVENIVQAFVHSPESPCFYVENVLLTGLFGLWLWPEIFRDIEGAFANPFQAAPLDLYQENFVNKRPQIMERWKLLDDSQYKQSIRHMWQEKQGITNHFVHWQFLSEELLELALACIPAAHLKAIFERLLFDIKSNRSGLPDLIQFFPATNRYCMIEVKGPGDRLQDNQLRWLDYFATKAIPVEVWYVNWE